MGNIEKISKIKRETLSGEHYFQSLLEKAYIAQLLSEAELEKIQFDCKATSQSCRARCHYFREHLHLIGEL